MTISKDIALDCATMLESFAPTAYADLIDYIESIDSDTSIRAELRRAAMTPDPFDETSAVVGMVADSFCFFGEGPIGAWDEEMQSWFLLMVAESL